MAFQDYQHESSSIPEVAEPHDQQRQSQQMPQQVQQQLQGQQAHAPRAQQAPTMVPLSLELVPPVLCQSFGVPMHDSHLLQRHLLGYGVPNTLAQRGDLFRFGGHAEQPFLADQAQLSYQATGQLASLGQVGPLMYGLGNDTVGLVAQQAYANRMLQCNSAFSAQQQQVQQQNGSHVSHQGQREGQPQLGMHHQGQAMPSISPGQAFHCSQGIAVPGSSFIDPNLLRHAVVQPMDTRAGAVIHSDIREEEARGIKRSSTDPAGLGFGRTVYMEPVKRSRLVWTPELHQRFEEAVDRAGGIDIAVPKTVLEHMAVPSLTRDNVASHLQKHRMNMKKMKETTVIPSDNTQINSPCASLSGTEDGKQHMTRSSLDLPVVHTAASADIENVRAIPKKRTPSASYLPTSDSGSGRTAITLAVLSGVNSTPDSRETIVTNGNGLADIPSASNIASSTRCNGSNGNTSNGNGSSTVDGTGLTSNGRHHNHTTHNNGVSSASPVANTAKCNGNMDVPGHACHSKQKAGS